MLKPQVDWDTLLRLPRLQKRILLSLAHDGPQTRNELSKNVGSEWKNVRIAFKTLVEKKGLVQELAKKKYYRGQKFSQFWLTQIGVLVACEHNANLKVLKQNALALSKNKDQEETLNQFFDMIEALGPEPVFRFTRAHEGKLELMSIPLNVNQANALIGIAKKYPRLWEEIKQGLRAYAHIILKKVGKSKRKS